MKLFECYDDRNCDKGHLGKRKPSHQYYRVYEPAFEKLDGDFKILEIGVLKGASIEAHLNYFEGGMFYGMDTFERVPIYHERLRNLSNNPRVELAEVDSTQRNEGLWEGIKFDIIIDDGNHTPDAQRLTLKHNWSRLKKGGVYFIEDVFPIHLMTDDEADRIISRYEGYNSEDYNRHQFSLLIDRIEACGNYTEHDLRNFSTNIDSFIIEIKK